MELLVAVDLVAAEERPAITTTTMIDGNGHRRWRDPAFAAMVAGLVCLVLLSLGYWRQSDQATSLRTQTTNISRLQTLNHRLLSEIESCTTPKGACAQRSAKGQAAAIDQIVQRLTAVACALAYSGDQAAIHRCVVRGAAYGVTGGQ